MAAVEYFLFMLFDKAGVDLTSFEGSAAGEVVEERNIGGDAGNFIVAEGFGEALKGALTVEIPDH